MKIIVFGYAQHGKDTACEYVRSAFNLRYISSSWFACQHFLYDNLKDIFGYSNIDECYKDRINHRALWYTSILRYNTPDLSKLGTEIFEDHSIYCGIRDRDEFLALKSKGLVDLAIWIDASGRLLTEDSQSMKLNKEDADIIIENNGSLDELNEKLFNLFKNLKLK